MKKILVSGYYGFNNAGDEAILESLLGIFQRVFEGRGDSLQVTVLSADPQSTAEFNGVDAVYRLSLRAILKALRRCDLFISGGGGLLQDKTGRGLSVAYYLGLLFLARAFRKPTLVYAQGIGPITGPVNRLLTRLILNRVDLVSVRDRESYRELISLGVTKPPLCVTADPAFYLAPEEDAGQITYGNIPSFSQEDTPVIGVSVKDTAEDSELLGEIALALDLMARELKAEVVFIPMFPRQDIAATRYTASLMDYPSYVLEEELRPRKILDLFTRFDLCIGLRLHSLIFAAAAGALPVGVGRDPKIASFISQLGPGLSCFFPEVRAEELYEECAALLRKKEELRSQLLSEAEQFHRETISCGEKIYSYFFSEAAGERGGAS